MADYEKKDLEKYLKNYISQLQGKSEKEQMDFLSNMRDKRTKEIKAEDPTVEVQYHPELDALGMLYQSVANGNDPKLEYEFDDDYEVVNDKSIDAIKDNFTPPGAKSKKKRIRATDNPDWVWDNEDVAKRFMATPYLNGNFSKEMSDKDKAALKENYKAYKKMSIDDFLKSKDFQPFYEYVGEDEEVEPNNYTSKTLWGEGEQNPYADIDKVLDEWDKEEIDTNDNGKIEVDEMADFQKSLDDYASKNKKGRDDIPVTTRR